MNHSIMLFCLCCSKHRYNYLTIIKQQKTRPSVWMARASEMTQEGRDDLKQAITRYGGVDYICKVAKLVPYQEWRYFESNFELLLELQKYLVLYHDGREDTFPKLSDIRKNGHECLCDLILAFGGRKMVATRLNMEFQAQTKLEVLKGMSFGRFSLSFAIRLMYFIRNGMLEKEPPLANPTIRMPTTEELVQKGEHALARDVAQFGGHENVARRLNLNFDVDEAKREPIIIWDGWNDVCES